MMAPAAVEQELTHNIKTEHAYPVPIKPSGSLEQFQYEDTTPVIGREFFDINLVDDILNAPDADKRLRDLAYTSM